jgi:hypothetical protein
LLNENGCEEAPFALTEVLGLRPGWGSVIRSSSSNHSKQLIGAMLNVSSDTLEYSQTQLYDPANSPDLTKGDTMIKLGDRLFDLVSHQFLSNFVKTRCPLLAKLGALQIQYSTVGQEADSWMGSLALKAALDEAGVTSAELNGESTVRRIVFSRPSHKEIPFLLVL